MPNYLPAGTSFFMLQAHSCSNMTLQHNVTFLASSIIKRLCFVGYFKILAQEFLHVFLPRHC